MKVLNIIEDPILFARERVMDSPGLIFMVAEEEGFAGAAFATKADIPVFLHISCRKEGFVEMHGVCLTGRLKRDAPTEFNLNHHLGRAMWLNVMDRLDEQAPEPEIH